VNQLWIHQLLFQKRAQEYAADFPRAQHRDSLRREELGRFTRQFRALFGRICLFHGECIVDDHKRDVNILPSPCFRCLGRVIPNDARVKLFTIGAI
jgi:hypothetical protein